VNWLKICPLSEERGFIILSNNNLIACIDGSMHCCLSRSFISQICTKSCKISTINCSSSMWWGTRCSSITLTPLLIVHYSPQSLKNTSGIMVYLQRDSDNGDSDSCSETIIYRWHCDMFCWIFVSKCGYYRFCVGCLADECNRFRPYLLHLTWPSIEYWISNRQWSFFDNIFM
jgi:hypothetical protein